MLGSLSVVLLAAAAAATPCESLRSVPLQQATIASAFDATCDRVPPLCHDA